jgi:hypothetical protein
MHEKEWRRMSMKDRLAQHFAQSQPSRTRLEPVDHDPFGPSTLPSVFRPPMAYDPRESEKLRVKAVALQQIHAADAQIQSERAAAARQATDDFLNGTPIGLFLFRKVQNQ